MSRAQIVKDVWYRYIHDTWENLAGYRTDIAASVLENPNVKRALFILDDTRGIFVSMDDLRRILRTSPRRSNGMVGPFNVNPHSSTVDGVSVQMEIKLPRKKEEPNKAPEPTPPLVTPRADARVAPSGGVAHL